MQKKAVILVPFLASVAAVAAIGPEAALRPASVAIPTPPSALPPAAAPAPSYHAPPVSSSISQALAQWNSLRQSDSFPFTSYASFLMRYRGWP